MKFGQSQPAHRVEDHRFLTGQGRYVDDIAPKNALRAWFLRSDRAHGVITHLDVAAARDVPGVHLVLTADDLRAAGVQTGMRFSRVTNRDGRAIALDRLTLRLQTLPRREGYWLDTGMLKTG